MSRFPTAILLALTCLALPARSSAQAVAAPGNAARATPGWHEDFEGPVTSWAEVGGDASYTVVAHQRVRGGAHGGQGCEWIQVAGQGGTKVFFAHDIGRPWVIEELRPTLWVCADRAALQFVAEITLPRTLDPRTGKPLTTQIAGGAYGTPGRWQQLEIVNMPRALLAQVHILRSQLSIDVDSREAYVSRVLLNVFGGAGVTNVWTDDLEVFGHVSSNSDNKVSLAAPPGGAAAASPGGPANINPAAASAAANRGPPEPLRREVKLANSKLTINGYPLFPRAVEYRGERLAFLKQLGFNTIWLRTVPSREFLWEARQLDLWLISPPPEFSGDAIEGAIGPEFEPVLAWDLGHGLTGETLEASRRRAQRIQLADSRFSRPTICAPANNLRNYSRQVDLLLIDRRPLGTSMQMPFYGTWVNRQPLVARPGTPVWTTIQTQAGEGMRRQLAALAPGQPPTAMGSEQIRLLVYQAISSGSRGLLFLSDSSLEAQDGETRNRVLTLHLLNVELGVVEPLVAGGSVAATAQSSQPLVNGVILRDDRARLVLPMWLAPGSQCVAPLAAAKPLTLTLPGIPESSSIYELSGGRLEPLVHQRVSGGTRVTLEEFGLSSMIFLAQDPQIIESVNRRAAGAGQEISHLERYLAGQKLDTVSRVYAQIGNRMPQINPAAGLEFARRDLKDCDARLASGDFAMASASARHAMMPLRQLERAAWEVAMTGRESPVEIPGTSSFETLPWYWAFIDRIRTLRPGANRLPGGDFENLAAMVNDGWTHIQNPMPFIQTAADLVPEAAHGGRTGLRLTARADTPENPPAIIELPPLWVSSPAVPVEAGQIVEIQGWVNVPTAITGSVDGLMIIDSLAGEEMALRIDKTAGWQQFGMLRIVPQRGPLVVTFVLTGLGEVRLDDVTARVLEPGFGAAARQ